MTAEEKKMYINLHKEMDLEHYKEVIVQNSKMRDAIIYFLELDRSPVTSKELDGIYSTIKKKFKESLI